MSNTQQTSQVGVTGITEKLKHNLSSLLRSSQDLREALITRDVDLIWQLLAEQEEQMRELEQHNYLWNQLFGDMEETDPSITQVKEEIRGDMHKLRDIEQCNGHLSRSYLNAIKKAMKVTGSKLAAKTNVYGRRGKMKMKKSSLMINSIG